MTNEFDNSNHSLRTAISMILGIFALAFFALAVCSVKRRDRRPASKKTLELNEEEFRENI
jgi:heme/copper-type cytochrome/quinol oxidase subunit 2